MKTLHIKLLRFYQLVFLLFLPCLVQSQPLGSFQIDVPLGLESHTVAFYVPLSYNPNDSWHLIVGLHGGGGSGVGYRNYLIDVADAYPAIVVCPDNDGASFSGPAEQLILKSIDTACHLYHIDTTKIVLNGYSMNGFETYRLGLGTFYPFKGIIPYNAVMLDSWLSQLNLNSSTPACICEGSLDSYYNLNYQIYNTLNINGGRAAFQSIPGVDHDLDPHFAPAVLNCMYTLDSLLGPVGVEKTLHRAGMDIFPNPTDNILYIKLINNIKSEYITITDRIGRRWKAEYLAEGRDQIIRLGCKDLPNGFYILHLTSDGRESAAKFIVSH